MLCGLENSFMGKIDSVTRQTDNAFLNMYHIHATSIHNTPVNYFLASRREQASDLRLYQGDLRPDGVAIYSLYGEKHDKVVLVRQYRYTIGTYIYEFPAGLVEPEESFSQAAIRELKEETGLSLTPIPVDSIYERPYFTTIGITDEACATVYGYASGEISTRGEEESEEIEVVIADRSEVRRILKEERVAIMCAYMLMQFINTEEPFAFLKGADV